MHWKLWVKSVVEHRDGGNAFSAIARPFLHFGSLVFNGTVSFRRSWWAGLWNRQQRLPCPVISVGNITWGGTGKTPMVAYLSQIMAKELNIQPIVLTRGYGGDEEYLLRERLKPLDGIVGVGGDRHKVGMGILSSTMVMGRFGDSYPLEAHASGRVGDSYPLEAHASGKSASKGQVVILDDGYQYFPLYRDLDVVMVNLLDPFGNGNTIPAGPLREPMRQLNRADVVVLNHAFRGISVPGSLDETGITTTYTASAHMLQMTKEHILSHLDKAHSVEWLLSGMFVKDIVSFDTLFHDSGRQSLFPTLLDLAQSETETTVQFIAFAGLGCFASFELTVNDVAEWFAQNSLDIQVELCEFVDHHTWTREDLTRLIDRTNSLQSHNSMGILLTTEKDAFRLQSIASEDPTIQHLLSTMRVWVVLSELRLHPEEHCMDLVRHVAETQTRARKDTEQ